VRRQKTLQTAWLAIHRNARRSKSRETQDEIKAFELRAHTNLARIAEQLQRKKFKFPPSKGVPIRKGKARKDGIRPLVVAKVEGRIVQRAVHDVLVTVPALKPYVRTPYSFGGIKKAKEDMLSAVPAAVQAVLVAIADGAQYYIRSDITGFFTKIPKSTVTALVSKAVGPAESEFMELFSQAITVELENMEKLAQHKDAFPLYDVGVAQGNSLSPLLGNILLADFDHALNATVGVRCLRYIDDFIILAPDKATAETKYKEALSLLSKWKMTVSNHKMAQGLVTEKFEFLGIQFANGFLRPSTKSRDRHIGAVRDLFSDSRAAIIECRKTDKLDPRLTYLHTMSKLTGTMVGWGRHYWFCRDDACFRQLDEEIEKLYAEYRGFVGSEFRRLSTSKQKWRLLGLPQHHHMERRPFLWPKKGLPYVSPGSVPLAREPIVSVEIDTDIPPWE
jgi:hypothetical protein